MDILAERMRLLRKSKGLRQDEMAKILDVSLSAYRRYELKERDPIAPFIVAFAGYFNVSTDYLLGVSDRP